MSRRWPNLLWAVSAGLVMVVVTGIVAIAATRPHSYLAALQSDPMASATIPQTTEIRRSEAESGLTPGEPVYAEVIRVLEVDSDPEAALQAADELAGENGWTLTSRDKDEYHYERSLITATATLSLSWDYTQDPEDHPHVLGDSLTVYLSASDSGIQHDHDR